MKHLTQIQIQEIADGDGLDLPAAREAYLHLSNCADCRTRLDRELKFDRALEAVPRVEPAPDLVARILAAQAATATEPATTSRPVRAGLAAGLAGLIVLFLLYQTALALQANGALDFISFYAAQPEVVTMYPNEAVSALVESLPLLQIFATLGVLVIELVLMRQFLAGLAFAQPSESRS